MAQCGICVLVVKKHAQDAHISFITSKWLTFSPYVVAGLKDIVQELPSGVSLSKHHPKVSPSTENPILPPLSFVPSSGSSLASGSNV